MTKKKNATEQKTSKSADGKTWVMPKGKPKAVKKCSQSHGVNVPVCTKDYHQSYCLNDQNLGPLMT